MTGSAYVFSTHDNGLTWTQQQKLVASNGATGGLYGVSVALRNDTIVVGSHRHDSDKGTFSGYKTFVFTRGL